MEKIQQLLRPVRRRLSRQRALPRVAWALIAGGWIALVAGVLTLFGGSFTAGIVGIAVAFGLPLIVWTWTLFTPVRWIRVAQLVDRELNLHDRTVTALQLSDELNDPFAQLQLDDALHHLQQVNLNSIHLATPWQRLASGVVLTLFSVGLIMWGIAAPPTAAIQTSGDMQDIRPEVEERELADLGPVNLRMLKRSADLHRRSQDISGNTMNPSLGTDVAREYFDSLAN